jgi:hypothetical protein
VAKLRPDGGGAPTEEDALRVLAGDPSLTSTKLRLVAAELGIDLPPDMRAKSAMQLHIAHAIGSGHSGAPKPSAPAALPQRVPTGEAPFTPDKEALRTHFRRLKGDVRQHGTQAASNALSDAERRYANGEDPGDVATRLRDTAQSLRGGPSPIRAR